MIGGVLKGIGRYVIDKDLTVEVYSDGVQIVYKGKEYPIEPETGSNESEVQKK